MPRLYMSEELLKQDLCCTSGAAITRVSVHVRGAAEAGLVLHLWSYNNNCSCTSVVLLSEEFLLYLRSCNNNNFCIQCTTMWSC